MPLKRHLSAKGNSTFKKARLETSLSASTIFRVIHLHVLCKGDPKLNRKLILSYDENFEMERIKTKVQQVVESLEMPVTVDRLLAPVYNEIKPKRILDSDNDDMKKDDEMKSDDDNMNEEFETNDSFEIPLSESAGNILPQLSYLIVECTKNEEVLSAKLKVVSHPVGRFSVDLLCTKAKEIAKNFITVNQIVKLNALREFYANNASDSRLIKMVLSYLPYHALCEMQMWHREEPWYQYLTGDVVNSSLLRDTWRSQHLFLHLTTYPENFRSCLIPVYANSGLLRPKIFGIRQLDAEEIAHPRIEQSGPVKIETDCPVIDSLQGFRYIFDQFTKSMFKGIDWSGIFIAGGSVMASFIHWEKMDGTFEAISKYSLIRRALLKNSVPSRAIELIMDFSNLNYDSKKFDSKLHSTFFRSQKKVGIGFEQSDIDLFLVANSEEQAKEKVHYLVNFFAEKMCAARDNYDILDDSSEDSSDDISVNETRNLKRSSDDSSSDSDSDEGSSSSDSDERSSLNNNDNEKSKDNANRVNKKKLKTLSSIRLLRTANAITVWCGYPYRNIQIVVVLYRSMDEVLHFFDLDCVCVGYDGFNVYAHPRFIRAVNTGYNFVEPAKLRRWSTGPRIVKYSKRGFGTVFFEICKHLPRCDVELDEETAKKIAAVASKTTAVEELNYGEVPLPFSDRLTQPTHMDSYMLNHQAELKQNQKLQLGPDGLLHTNDDSNFLYINPGKTNIDDILEPEFIPGIRWKNVDLWESRRGNEFLPKCYMCLGRIDPYMTRAERPKLCRQCEDLNELKRNVWVDLSGKIALVTGGRIKIGFVVALRLLRCNATVLVTTRFPHDAVKRFQEESDFETFQDRLHIYGVDFRDLTGLTYFLQTVQFSFPKLDIIINNAAQTIRRPPAYYKHLAETEQKISSHPCIKNASSNNFVSVIPLLSHPQNFIESFDAVSSAVVPSNSTETNNENVTNLAYPAALTQIPLVPGDEIADNKNFPQGKKDIYGEQLDLRDNNSWTSTLGNIPFVETIEVQMVNSVAPFTIVNTLLPMLLNNPEKQPRFVINVTSPEGQFDLPFKSPNHPHTNMAKAALNMLTRTIAENLCQSQIYVSSVDTGWVSTMVPETKPAPWNNKISPPLGLEDGGSRVLDPIFSGYEGKPIAGVLLKNFSSVCW